MFRTIFDDFWGFDPFIINKRLLGNWESSFSDEKDFNIVDNKYNLTITIPENVKVEDINLSIEDENMLCVSYSSETEKSKMSYSTKRSIPEDMDASTLRAVMEGNILVITSDVKTVKPIEIPINSR